METNLLSFISVSYFISIEMSKDFFSFAYIWGTKRSDKMGLEKKYG